MQVYNYKERTKGAYTIKIEIVDFCQGSPWFSELYTPADCHQAGETIQVPSHLQHRNGHKFYTGQYTPSQLASDYAKQGRENPSREAYESLQKEMGYYITATDCALRCRVLKAGIELAKKYSVGFDYSYEYTEASIEDMAKNQLSEHGRDFIKEAISEARDTLQALAA